MTVITENGELIITLNVIVWCFVVATVIAYVVIKSECVLIKCELDHKGKWFKGCNKV